MGVVTAAEQGVVAARSYLNGEWVTGGGEEIEVKNPATGKLVSRLNSSTAEEVVAAVAAAREARRAWAATPVAVRIEPFRRAVDLVESRRDELKAMICQEVGKTQAEADDDIFGLLANFLHTPEDALRHAGKIVPPTWTPNSKRRVLITHAPVGVVAVMSPWNFPAAIPSEMITPAIASGNVVVWKPSEWTPGTSQILAEIIADAGFPKGVFNVVQGRGNIGAQLVEHPETDMVAFVGSTATGEVIARAAGIKKLLLELGGNGPFVVMEDADVEAAVEATVEGAFYLAGQVCTAAERLLVHDAVHDDFVAALADRARTLKVGDPMDAATEMGPLTVQSSLDKTIAHLGDATGQGAEIVAGGSHHDLFHDPTVLVDVTPEMAIAREETFGPVAPVIRFSSEEEMLRIANDSDYGLTGAIFTKSLERGWELAEQIDCGTVHVNETTNYWELLAPFGGMKKSGIGRVLGDGALESFTNSKQITYDRARPKA
ncbi:MAG: aldehyde dehydrogenase [Actinobacteria bacterium]|nr:aldehyde dehydrogenase [Actinomycetota bacterium]